MFFNPTTAQDIAADRAAELRRDAATARAARHRVGTGRLAGTARQASPARPVGPARLAGPARPADMARPIEEAGQADHRAVAGSLPTVSVPPLFRRGRAGEAGYMKLINHMPSGLRKVARKIASVVAECNWAQRRLAELRMDPERYVLTGRPPETFAEFLMRTSGPLRHEPPASQRGAGSRQLR